MRIRFLVGTAATLAAAGIVAAQQPAAPSYRSSTYPTTQQVGTPVRTAAAQAETRAMPMPPAPNPGAPVVGAPVMGAPIAAPGQLPPTAAPVMAAPAGPSTQLLTTCPSYANCNEQGAPGCAPACCEPCGPPGKFWVDAGYVFWRTSGQRVPALITRGPDNAPRAQAGALGAPGTTTLFGGNRVNNDFRSGFYVRAGMWFDDCQTRGIQGNFFFLEDNDDGRTAGGNGLPVVSRPFTNGLTGAQDVELVSFPNVLSGTVSARANTSVVGGGPSFVRNLCCGPCGRVDLLFGYTYLGIDDDVTIRENLTSLPGQTNVTPGTRFLIEDRFRTTNDFHGALVGIQGERRFGQCYVSYNASIAFGVNHQTIDIRGSTTIIPPNGTATTLPGGLLTQPSNIGRYTRDDFAVMPQFGMRLGCQLTERIRAYVGYDVAYLSNVVRAGDQIDLRVNPTQIPSLGNPNRTGPAVPAVLNKQTDFFMHGIRVGVEMRF